MNTLIETKSSLGLANILTREELRNVKGGNVQQNRCVVTTEVNGGYTQSYYYCYGDLSSCQNTGDDLCATGPQNESCYDVTCSSNQA